MIAAIPRIRADPLRYLAATVERFGDLVAFPMPRTPVLLVNTPAGAWRVLVENHRAYSKRTVQYGALSMVTGTGLLTADGEAWRVRRRIDQPAFHHGSLHVVARQSVQAAELMAAAVPPSGGVVDVDAACLQATMGVVGRTLFGDDLAVEGDALVSAVLSALEVVVARARTPVPAPAWLPTRGNRRLERANAQLDAACARVVSGRRTAQGAEHRQDLLALLLRAADEARLSEREVRDELVTMVIAGHETVASSLSWTLHLLATHPEAQLRLHGELDAVLGDRTPSWADVADLRWARAVVEESLRLFPPAWVLSRRVLVDDVVDGVPVPAGTLVIISPWLLHRRPADYERPEAFSPSRFHDDAARRRPDGSYLPFGAGPRLCIGRDFALVESVLVLAALLRRFRVRPVAGRRVRVDALVTLRPRGGMPLELLPR